MIVRDDSTLAMHILLVEDSAHDRMAFRRTLQKAGNATRITECEHPDAALALLGEEGCGFDLIVLDDRLPGRSGMDTCRELIDQRCPAPIVILTGNGSEQLAVQALKLGVDDYIIKDPGGRYLELLPVVLPDVVRQYRLRLAQSAAELQVIESRRRLAQIVESSPVPTFVIDHNHLITYWNRACEGLTGTRAADMVNTRDQWRAFYPSQRSTMADLIVDSLPGPDIERHYSGKSRKSALIEGAFEAEDFFPAIGKQGRWIFFTAAPLRDTQGHVVGAIETLQDFTEQRLAEAALRDSQRFLAQIVDGSAVATFVIDGEHRVTHWNHACEVLTGFSSRDLVGTRNHWRAFYESERPLMADLILDGTLKYEVYRLYHGKFRPSALVEGSFEAEDFFPGFGPGGKWLFFTAAPLRDAAGRVIGAIETLQDVTERKRAEQALQESEERYRTMSITDALTTLFNSRHFYEQLQNEVERAVRYERPLAMMLLDVDNFKKLNDTYGHLEGDQALQSLSRVIKEALRASDSAYRYGGEEFAILLPETTLQAAILSAERLRASFAATPQTLANGDAICCSISIGVAQLEPGEAPQDFVRRADGGVYQAKRGGKNRVSAAGGA